MTIRKPVYISEKLYKINKASNRLAKECKREPTLEEIARETNTSLESIEKVMQSFKDPISLDSFYEERGESIINFPQDKKPVFIPEQVIFSNLSQTIDAVLSNLTPREKKIVKLRFGIGATHDHTLEEIGKEFDLTRERIRQILEIALNKLKHSANMMELKDFIGFN
jgi:RNA polymerase primary sigma factor